ncbi:MAG: DUF3352 domain-containing protein [Thermoflexales bacterium]|nr:DUF3352 domain-containing protein [Thermoflexales bacterium]
MEESQTQSVEFNVNLPKPKPTSLLAKIVLAIGGLALIGAIAAVVISRTATPTVDPTVKVLPTDTMMLMSINTQTDQLPDFKAIADAWAGSKEANQIESTLELAFIQTGFNWTEDVRPWLGERVTVGLVDLGNYAQPIEYAGLRGPTFFVVAQTRDRAKSDAFLVNVRKEIERNIKPGDYVTTTLRDDAYRGIPLVYLTSETNYSGDKPVVSEVAAYATLNDVIVVTTSTDNLKQAIDAALDGRNLSLNANYQAVMNTLPGQNAFAMYVDFNRYMQTLMDMTLGISTQMSGFSDTPSTDLTQQQEQMQKLRDNLQAMGGMGTVMTYEPTGIRFDVTIQMDLAKMPEAQRKLYEASYQVAANKIYESIPAAAMALMNGNNPAGYLKPFFDPNQPDPFANFPGLEDGSFRDKLAEFEKLVGVNLNADLIDLFNGEFALSVLPKAQTVSDDPTQQTNLPFEFALMLESSDAARASATLDTLVQAIAATSDGDVKWQSLSGLPYSVVLADNGETPVLTYGVVDGRLVIGSTSETLLAIQNAKQAAITSDATFKTATGLLPGNRVQTGYLNFQPLWAWIDSQANGDSNVGAVLNYLSHFKWLSLSSGAPSNNLIRSEVHLAVGK